MKILNKLKFWNNGQEEECYTEEKHKEQTAKRKEGLRKIKELHARIDTSIRKLRSQAKG